MDQTTTKAILEVQSISKSFNNQHVLKDISFLVKAGEIVGFLGPNGAGKSTSMKIITGCIPADKGNVTIQGYSITGEKLKAQTHFGYLPEDNPLYGEMYVPEYLEYVAKIYHINSVKEKIRDAIHRIGLQPEMHKTISRLSKGYKQRVGIAQSILHDPELLILDEPTSGLDPNQIDQIMELLSSLSKEKAILFSSHTLSEVKTICTRIIIIHQGKIVLDSPTKEIDDLESLFKELTLK